jgi:preprotein translocase subunit SecE
MKAVKAGKKKARDDAEKGEKVQKAKPSSKDAPRPVKSKKSDVPKKKASKKSEGVLVEWWDRSKQYLREVYSELGKVVWPSRKETTASTWVVLVVVILVGVFLGFADLILSRAMRWIIG